MSVKQLPVAPAAKPRRFPRSRGRISRPGISLMAQGEPMVWLTGGAIVACVAMIVGLLALVACQGIPTFWPSRLVLLEHVDGKKTLGEITRTESYTLTQDILPILQEAELAEAKKRLQGTDRIVTGRRLVRTGNFEMTGEHFRSVFDFALKQQGETYPEWAVTVERVQWGRFYGEPKSFTVRSPRVPTDAEKEFDAILQFVDANRSRLPQDEAAGLDAALAPVKEQLETLRKQNTDKFLATFTEGGEKELFAVQADGTKTGWGQRKPDQVVVEVQESWSKPEATWQQYVAHHDEVRERFYERRDLEQYQIGKVNDRLEEARLGIRKQELREQVSTEGLVAELDTLSATVNAIQQSIHDVDALAKTANKVLPVESPLLPFVVKLVKLQYADIHAQLEDPLATRQQLESRKQVLPDSVRIVIDQYLAMREEAETELNDIQKRITEINSENSRFEWTMVISNGQEKSLALSDIVRAYPANRLSGLEKCGVYVGRWWEYLTDEPREANSEGGVMPAIWGTVVMTLVMSLLVVPFGVLAALYLREYARTGLMVSILRVAISNLAGVPSIVFGVFGLGFFCYWVGAYIDGGPANAGIPPLTARSWWLTLVGAAVLGLMAFAWGMWRISGPEREIRRSQRRWGYVSMVLWLSALAVAVTLIFTTPYFRGLYAASLPNPTFGKGGLIWASLTLALLTLPVVIVATEEALAAVPNSLREGSYACGASKWQTIRRIVLPHAMPGIMTGMILAMARGAGEVAPLMLVGAVKLSPNLPMDGDFPFVHIQRSFMHLGFHIFDQGMQSQNSEAAKPMVFTTTMLLIAIVAFLNLAAVWIRSKLRQRFQMGQF